MEVIDLPGVGEIKVRKSANIKYLRIRMAPGRGIWVSVPEGVGKKEVVRFLTDNKEWILRTRRDMQVYEQDSSVGLGIGTEVKTKSHVLKIVESDDEKPGYRLAGKDIILSVPRGLAFERIDGIVRHFILEIYKLECREYLPGRVRMWADRFGFKYNRLTFRDNVSNWGSCSFDNNISLNVKLMKLPDELIDYVILHELCHTVEKNHSEAFWKLVGKVCPNYEILRKRLKNFHTRI